MFLNNNLVWQKQYWDSQDSQVCGASIPGWDELFDFISVTFTHNGGSLTIKFDSTLDQAANDEWWGVDRIMIRKYSPSEPTISLGKELGSFVIKSNTYSFNLYFTGKSSSSLGSKYIATLYLANNSVIQREIDIGCNLGSECKISKIINLGSDIDIEKIEICSKICSYICAKYKTS